MTVGKYSLAGQIIEIRSRYEKVHVLWSDYAAQGEPDIIVEITPEDLDFEREKAIQSARREGRTAISADDGLETLAVYRKVAERLVERGTFLFHGSAICVDGEAYVFTAASGTGKSTHTALWRRLFGDRAFMINDDKPLIRVTEGGAFVIGTPYNGKHRLGTNAAAPLKAICVLERGEQNVIREITYTEMYPMLVQQTFRPRSGEALAATLSLLDELKKHVRFYRLSCNMDIEAAKVAYDGMNGDLK